MKDTILFGSLLAVFIMLTIPNINAVEYTSIKQTIESRINIFQERTDALGDLIHSIDFLSETYDLSASMTKIIVIITFILQGFFMSGMYALSNMILDSIEYALIGVIVYFLLMNLTAFILVKWDDLIIKIFDLTRLQETIIEIGDYFVYFIIIVVYGLISENNIFPKLRLYHTS